jgi:hypothetical protein
MAKPPLSHFSPVFANLPWANDAGYISYYRDQYRRKVQRATKGKRQWGRRRGLYSWKVELALNRDLETEAARTYSDLLKFKELDADQRLTWAQFLLSQVVRTPTFLRYELAARRMLGITDAPAHDRVGCKDCGDTGGEFIFAGLTELATEVFKHLRRVNPVHFRIRHQYQSLIYISGELSRLVR